MKHLLTLIVLTFFCQGTFAQNDDQAISHAFLEHLSKKEFDAAYDQFSAELQKGVKKEQLSGIWNAIEGQAGKYKKIRETKSQIHEGVNIFVVSGEFEKQIVNFTLPVENGQIVGFFYAPGELLKPHIAASYDKKNYSETPLNLKTADCELEGLLTIPTKSKGKVPVVIFVHGSGNNDKDESVGPNKVFKDLSAGLAGKGIGSYRYDKRSLTCPGTLMGKPFTPDDEVVNDVLQAIDIVKRLDGVDSSQIYVAGHSLGGMLAPRIAELSKIKGIILLNANAQFLGDLVIDQLDYLHSIGTLDEKSKDELQSEIRLVKSDKFNDNAPDENAAMGLPSAYWNYLKKYSQTQTAANLNNRILVINSGRDYQVPATEFELWKMALKNSKNTDLKLFPDLNHLLIKSPKQSKPSDYEVQGNVSEEVIVYISKWILKGS